MMPEKNDVIRKIKKLMALAKILLQVTKRSSLPYIVQTNFASNIRLKRLIYLIKRVHLKMSLGCN